MDQNEWQRRLLFLSTGLKSSMWEMGDLYNLGKREFGPKWCKAVVTAPGWVGIEYPTLLVYASVAKRFPPLIRIKDAAPALHQLAAPLPDDVALPLLQRAVREGWNVNRMRTEVSHIRCFNPLIGGEVADDIAMLIAKGRKYRGLLADPPWPWNTSGGMAGSNASYYLPMTMDELFALRVAEVVTSDAFLFLWCPPALLKAQGLPLMEAWGFEYQHNATWDKGNFGRGSYFRTEHEHLLLGVREKSPTHFIDNATGSMIRTPHSRNNSEKPPDAHRIVERAIGGPYIEFFARKHMPGWSCYGNQLEPIAEAHQLAAD